MTQHPPIVLITEHPIVGTPKYKALLRAIAEMELVCSDCYFLALTESDFKDKLYFMYDFLKTPPKVIATNDFTSKRLFDEDIQHFVISSLTGSELLLCREFIDAI